MFVISMVWKSNCDARTLWDVGFEPGSAAAKRLGPHIIYGDVIYSDAETVLLLTTTIRI